MVPLLLIASLALQAWVWRRLTARLRAGTLTRLRCAVRFAGWAFLPVVLFVGAFLAMVGLEEWLGLAMLGERTALLVLPTAGLSVLGSLTFGVRCALAQRPGQADR